MEKALGEALKGKYGTYTMSNGIKVLYQGAMIHYEGAFDGSQNVIEVPVTSSRIAVMFTGDSGSCCSIVEPDNGFVNVPKAMKGNRFFVLATGILNY